MRRVQRVGGIDLERGDGSASAAAAAAAAAAVSGGLPFSPRH